MSTNWPAKFKLALEIAEEVTAVIAKLPLSDVNFLTCAARIRRRPRVRNIIDWCYVVHFTHQARCTRILPIRKTSALGLQQF